MTNENTNDFDEQVRLNQAELSDNLDTSFEYVVCGAGTSGSVVAARLAEDPNVRVLVLEAGGTDESELVRNPNAWPMTLGSELDWGFVAEPNPHLNGRAIGYSMGKALGGGSSINVGTWSRGHQTDWDSYAAQSGNDAWSYDSVLKLYRERIEAWTGNPDPGYRGSDGMVHLQPAPKPHAFSKSVLESAQSIGVRRFPNPNGQMMEAGSGCAYVDEIVLDGARKSIFRSYLYPLMGRPNVTVLTGALVGRIVIEDGCAAGVEFQHDKKMLTVRATKEVILSMGAINTPKILMLSGIGDGEELKKFDIPVVRNLPGVGRNLHDHVAIGCVWQVHGVSPPQIPRSEVVAFWKSDAQLKAPNFYAYATYGAFVSAENAARIHPPADCWSFAVGMRPKSRGAVHLTGPKPTDAVTVDAAYLSDPDDIAQLLAGIEIARKIGNSGPMQKHTKQEVAPGAVGRVETERYIRDGLSTFWHQCGTAKMGTDRMSVVDGELRVHGIMGLRIADASILPHVTTGNTMAPCVVIGEQAARFIREG